MNKPTSTNSKNDNNEQKSEFVAETEDVQFAFPEETNMMIELIRNSLSESAGYSSTLFLDCTQPITRDKFLEPKGIVDDGLGCVYAYFNDEGAVYVGITGLRVKSRLKTPTSPHLEAEWWPSWTHMRFLPLKSASDRIVLEYLLILGLAPVANQKPGAMPIRHFLKELEGD